MESMIVTLFQNGSVEILSNIKSFQPRILAPLSDEDVYVLQLILPSSIDTNGLLLLDESLNDIPLIKRVTTLSRESPLIEFYFDRPVFEKLQSQLLSLNIRYFDNVRLSWNVSYVARLNEDSTAIDYLEGIVHIMNSGEKDIGPALLRLVVKKLERLQPEFAVSESLLSYQRKMPTPTSSYRKSAERKRESRGTAAALPQEIQTQLQQAFFESQTEESAPDAGSSWNLDVTPQMEAVGEGSKVELPDPLLLQKQTMTDVLILHTEGCRLKKIHSWSLDQAGTGERQGSAAVTYMFQVKRSPLQKRRQQEQEQDQEEEEGQGQLSKEGSLPGGVLSLYSSEMNFLGDFSIPRLLFSKPVILKVQDDDHVQVKSFFRTEIVKNPLHQPRSRSKSAKRSGSKSHFSRTYYHYSGAARIENHHPTPIQIRLDFAVDTPRIKPLFVEGAEHRMNLNKSRIELRVTIPPQSHRNVKFEFVSLPAEP